jgi:hypothetical protein
MFCHTCTNSALFSFWWILACDLEKQVAVTPVSISPHIETDIQTATSDWISAVTPGGQ